MRDRATTIILIALFSVMVLHLSFSHAAETRGLRVVAKDPASGQSGEVKLYNKSYAVIIGIDNYPTLPQDRQLSYAVKDAKGIEKVLKQQYKFDNIITLYDQQATKNCILELLTDELPTKLGEDDSLFIFWAGHGNQEKKPDGDLGYLVPFDGSIGKLSTVITMDEIKNTISKIIPAKHVFYVFDACYSGLLTTRSVDNKSRRDLAYLKEITRERVRQVLTAGTKGQEVLDSGRNGHSVFTGRLIELLETRDDFVTANEIQAAIREKVSGDARARGHKQTPAYDAISGSGDYVFVPNSQNKLVNLSATSAARQKEIEQLQTMERDAEAAKQKERDEIAKREAELAALDKQISDMKARLGSNAIQSNDSLDAIVAMAEQRELHERQLDEIKRRRESEANEKQNKLEKIERDEEIRIFKQLVIDFEKYKKIAQSQYAQHLKASAWETLLAKYPKAKSVPEGNFVKLISSLDIDLELITGIKFVGIQRYRKKNANIDYTSHFSVSKYYITNAQFRKFRPKHDSGLETEIDTLKWSKEHNRFDLIKGKVIRNLNEDHLPVTNITWQDAIEYSKWLSRRTSLNLTLPSDDDFEFIEEKSFKNSKSEYYQADELLFSSLINISPPKNSSVYLDQLGLEYRSGIWSWTSSVADSKIFQNNKKTKRPYAYIISDGKNDNANLKTNSNCIIIRGYGDIDVGAVNKSCISPDSRKNRLSFRLLLDIHQVKTDAK